MMTHSLPVIQQVPDGEACCAAISAPVFKERQRWSKEVRDEDAVGV